MAFSHFQRSSYKTLFEGKSFKVTKEKSITKEPAIVCNVLLPQLIAQILGKTRNSVTLDTVNAITRKLSVWLQKELKGRDIPVRIDADHVQRTVQAVHSKLLKKRSQNDIIVNLLVLQDKLCTTIVDTLVKQLIRPGKTLSIKKFFTSVYISISNSVRSYEMMDNEYV